MILKLLQADPTALRPEANPKMMGVHEAVERFLRPGMTIHVGNSHAWPIAMLYEIVRRFWGRRPDFTLVLAAASSVNAAPLVHGRLCKKLITSFAGDGYPFPGPNPVFQRAYTQGLGIEEWTMLTLTLRLMAGALDLPFLSTQSLLGSSLAELAEHNGEFTAVSDPFKGRQIGLVRALKPDISLAHGLVADPYGNVLLTPPFVAGAWGALAAREGVLVTVEKIVDTDFIRKHSYLVRIPRDRVLAVCEAPFGAHPGGHQSFGIAGVDIEGYTEDRDFILQARFACQNPAAWDRWIHEWILSCPDHTAYLEKLSSERLKHLQERLHPEAWREELQAHLAEESGVGECPPTPAECMIVAAARRIAHLVRERGYKTILAGIGASHLAAWLAYYQLAQEGVPVDLIAEMGPVGYTPLPADPFIFNVRNAPTSTMNTELLTVLGALTRRECLGVLGAAQIDKHGNINSSRIPEERRWLVGSGGANDVASAAEEIAVVVEQSPQRFVERVPYVTAPGVRVTTVISQLGVYEKRGEELILTGCFEDPTEAQAACGWKLRIADRVPKLPPPTPKELERLRAFDPERFFLGDGRKIVKKG